MNKFMSEEKEEYKKALQYFINRVEDGTIISKTTYKMYKDLINKYEIFETKITDMSLLESGEYYRINGTKKKLYWAGEKWMKPQKDTRGSYSGFINSLEIQPKIKFVEKITNQDLYE